MNDGKTRGIDFFPMITKKDGAPDFAMRLFEIKPNGHTPKHSHDWEHEVFIVSGNGYILRGNENIVIEKEDFIFIPAGEIHQFTAGDDGISFICVVPNRGQPE